MNKNGIAPENPVLPAGLVGSGFQKLPGPVGGYQDQGNVTHPGFHDGREQISDGGAGGGDRRRGNAGAPGDSQSQKPQSALIKVRMKGEFRKAASEQGEGSAAGSRGHAEIPESQRNQKRENAVCGQSAGKHDENLSLSAIVRIPFRRGEQQ